MVTYVGDTSVRRHIITLLSAWANLASSWGGLVRRSQCHGFCPHSGAFDTVTHRDTLLHRRSVVVSALVLCRVTEEWFDFGDVVPYAIATCPASVRPRCHVVTQQFAQHTVQSGSHAVSIKSEILFVKVKAWPDNTDPMAMPLWSRITQRSKVVLEFFFSRFCAVFSNFWSSLCTLPEIKLRCLDVLNWLNLSKVLHHDALWSALIPAFLQVESAWKSQNFRCKMLVYKKFHIFRYEKNIYLIL